EGTQPPRLSGARLVGGKTQANVVGEPFAVGVAESRPKCFANFVNKNRAVAGGQRRHETLRKRLQPSINFGGQRGGAGNQRDIPDGESPAREARGVILDGREVPRIERVAVDAAARKRVSQRAL